MKLNSKYLMIFILSLAGTLFSGYLTFSKFITGICPLNETCRYLWGQPTCLYGLIIYSALLILSGILVFKKSYHKKEKILNTIVKISGFSVLFTGYYSFVDLLYPICPLGNCRYALILPTCIYGFIMYVIILTLSLRAKQAFNAKK